MTLLPLTTRLLAGSLATVTAREVAGLLSVTLAEPKTAHRLDVAPVMARVPRRRAL